MTFQLAGIDLAVQYKAEVLADCEPCAGGSFSVGSFCPLCEANLAGETFCTTFPAPEHLWCLAPALLQSFLEAKGTEGYLSSFKGRFSHSTALSC